MRIGILGAGAVGCYLGARLANAGSVVTLVGRKRLIDAAGEQGLHYEGLSGGLVRVDPDQLRLSERAEALEECDCVFVTVKSGQTQEAAEILAPILSKSCPVVSFQNGVRNSAILKETLPESPILAGIVPFNVIWDEPAIFRQGTSGPLVLQDSHALARELATKFESAGLPIELIADMQPLQWGKLLMNLNNAINALSGVPLVEELHDRDYRVCLAASQSEALGLLRRAGIKMASPLKLPFSWVPYVLRSPTPVFSRVARAMLHVGPEARS